MTPHDKLTPEAHSEPARQPSPPAQAAASGETRGLKEAEPEKKLEAKGSKSGSKKPKKSLGSRKRGTETVFRTAYRTHLDLSSLADTKANIMISINGLILSIIIAGVGPRIDANPWILYPVVVLLLVCLVSMVFAILSARPRINRHEVTLDDVRENKTNILFFGNYANLSEADYVEGMEELLQSGERIYHNMIRDLYGIGTVLMTKYRLLRYAYTVFMVGLVVSVLLFIVFFFGQAN